MTSCHKKEHRIFYNQYSSIGTVIDIGSANGKKIIDIVADTSNSKIVRTYEYESNINVNESLLGVDVVFHYKQCSSWDCEDSNPIIFKKK